MTNDETRARMNELIVSAIHGDALADIVKDAYEQADTDELRDFFKEEFGNVVNI